MIRGKDLGIALNNFLLRPVAENIKHPESTQRIVYCEDLCNISCSPRMYFETHDAP